MYIVTQQFLSFGWGGNTAHMSRSYVYVYH